MSVIAEYLKKSDVTLFLWFDQKIRCIILDVIMVCVTNLGSLLVSIAVPVLFILLGNNTLKRIGIELAVNLVFSHTIVQLLKRTVNRRRPYTIIESVIAIKPPSCKYSFPSGHTCAAFTMAFVLTSTFKSFGITLFPMATIVGISRAYLGFHYPTDIIVGLVISYISFVLSVVLFFRRAL